MDKFEEYVGNKNNRKGKLIEIEFIDKEDFIFNTLEFIKLFQNSSEKNRILIVTDNTIYVSLHELCNNLNDSKKNNSSFIENLKVLNNADIINVINNEWEFYVKIVDLLEKYDLVIYILNNSNFPINIVKKSLANNEKVMYITYRLPIYNKKELLPVKEELLVNETKVKGIYKEYELGGYEKY